MEGWRSKDGEEREKRMGEFERKGKGEREEIEEDIRKRKEGRK